MNRQRAFDLAVTAVIGLFLAACLFVQPAADDFIYASNARAGFWPAWWREYVGWNGRYASNALVLASPLAFGWTGGHAAAAAIMIAGVVGAIYLFVRALSGDQLPRRDALTCALTFSALFLSIMPSIGEGIYWYTSAATYHVPLVLMVLELALIVRYARQRDPASRTWMLPPLLLLPPILAGFNEVVMLMLVFIHGGLLLWSWMEAPRLRRLFAALLAATAAGALFVICSPGNLTRQSMFPLQHRLGLSVAMSALQTARFAGGWATAGPLLLATVVFVPVAAKLWGTGPDRTALRRSSWFVLGGLLLVVPAGVFPAYWATGVLGQHRTVNVACFAFLFLWFLAVSLLAASGSRSLTAVEALAREWRVPLALLLLVALGFTGNGYAVGLDLLEGRFAAFRRESEARVAAFRACREAASLSCQVDALDARPASFYVLDVSVDPRDWVNVSYARYFGLGEVRRRPLALNHVRD